VNRQVFEVPDQSIRVQVIGYGVHFAQPAKLERIHRVLNLFPRKVRVNLKHPSLNLFIIEQMTQASEPGNSLHRVYFGREVGAKSHSLQDDYVLRTLPLLSTTSMDPSLAFIMANMGKCVAGTLVCDPFVGSGSVLLACAEFGAHCVGMDYDARTFRGTGDNESTVKSNFAHHGTQDRLVGVVRADFSQQWMRRRAVFDAIVTDPPYGIREGVRRIGLRPNYTRTMPIPTDEQLGVRIPMRQKYPYQELLNDLLQFAADTLVDGGHLVFWHAMSPEIPVEQFDATKELPSNDRMILVNIGLQRCSSVNRRLVVYRKRNT
jgi:tRNA (guanine10-N2)-methyltransferase